MSDNIAQAMSALAGNQTSPKRKLIVDPQTKRLTTVPTDSQAAKNSLSITPPDLRVSSQ